MEIPQWDCYFFYYKVKVKVHFPIRKAVLLMTVYLALNLTLAYAARLYGYSTVLRRVVWQFTPSFHWYLLRLPKEGWPG